MRWWTGSSPRSWLSLPCSQIQIRTQIQMQTQLQLQLEVVGLVCWRECVVLYWLDLVPDLVATLPILKSQTEGASQTLFLERVIQCIIVHMMEVLGALLYLMVPDKEVLFLFVKGGVCSHLCPQNLKIVKSRWGARWSKHLWWYISDWVSTVLLSLLGNINGIDEKYNWSQKKQTARSIQLI